MSRRFQFSMGRLLGAVGWCASGSLFGSRLDGEPLDLLRVSAILACGAAAGTCFFGKARHSLFAAVGVFAAFMIGFAFLTSFLLLLPN